MKKYIYLLPIATIIVIAHAEVIRQVIEDLNTDEFIFYNPIAMGFVIFFWMFAAILGVIKFLDEYSKHQ